jgi:hypothetical protein
MKLIFEFAGEEVDVAEEKNRIAQQLSGAGKPAVPDQRTTDRQDAESLPGVTGVNGYGDKSQPQVNYDGRLK